MKIYYLVKNLDKIPSCAYNIQVLNKIGYKVIPVLAASTDGINKNFTNDGIEFKIMPSVSNKNKSIIRYIADYRRFVKSILCGNIKHDDIIVYGTADTAVATIGMFKGYKKIICVKELYDNDKRYRKLLIKLTSKADAVIACEINRARIMQFEWCLKTRPYVLPNKPYYHPRQLKCKPTSDITASIVEQIKNRPCIVYQANHIRFANELETLAKALCKTTSHYVLILIGNIDREKDIETLKSIYPDIITTGYLLSPSHMDITSYARIGITIYDENSLNNLFCAPNKIYEYSGYGIPTLANDVPGLIQTIGISGAGECVDWSKSENVFCAIEKIENDYESYSKKSSKFFDSVDNEVTLDKIIKAVCNKNIR